MSFPYMNTNLTKRLVFNKQERGNFSQGLMSFPYMHTNLTRRLVFDKQVDKRHFSQGLMSFPYKETCIQQASRQEREKADRE